MTKGTLVFTICHQFAQEYGTGDDMAVSRVYFNLVLSRERKVLTGLYADVKQTPGGSDLEVSYPKEIHGILGYDKFRAHVAMYYEASFGEGAFGFKFGSKMKMLDNIAIVPRIVTVDVAEPGEVGW